MKFGSIIALGALALGTSAMAAVPGPSDGWAKSNATFSTASGSASSWDYVYNPSAYTWDLGSDTGTGSTEGFNVSADVEMWMSMGLNATDINFHVGRDPGASYSPTVGITQDVKGWLNSNNGQYVFITKTGGTPGEADLSKLDFNNNVFGGTSGASVGYLGVGGAAPTSIPVTWSVTDASGSPAVTYSTGGNNSQLSGFQWLLDGGTIGAHTFTIHCTIHPDRFQQDGHYEMDPILVATPEL